MVLLSLDRCLRRHLDRPSYPTRPVAARVFSFLSADHQGGGCETELVEGGDELADVDDAVIMRIGYDSLLRAIDVKGVEPFEAAASPRLDGILHPFLNGHFAQVTTQMGDVGFHSQVRNAAELDAGSDEAGVAHGAVQCHKVYSRDILFLDFNTHTIGEVVQRLLVSCPKRVLIQLHLIRPGQRLKRRPQIVEATAAAQVIHLEDDRGFRKPGGTGETLTLDPEQHRKGAWVFEVVDSEECCGPDEGHCHNLPGIAER
jgi:hypothetical protein